MPNANLGVESDVGTSGGTFMSAKSLKCVYLLSRMLSLKVNFNRL